jgi:Zn-dependent peptidase ImmA (M78 family)
MAALSLIVKEIFNKETGRMEYTFDKVTLVPTNVNRDNYDEVAADFLTHYGCAQYLSTPMPVPIFEIARKRMGLTVYTDQQLSENCDVLGTIAFFDGDVEVYDSGTKSNISFAVKKGTVLIDHCIGHEGRKNNTMAHECVHWHIHRYYFGNLRRKTEDSDIAFRCPVRISDNDDSTRDEERMEKQARGIAPRILMPKESTKKKLTEIFVSRIIPKDTPERLVVLTEIVDELAEFFRVSKISAKYRMVDLGFMSQSDSLEIYNFDNNNLAIWDFSEHPLTVKTSNRPLTRHISLEHAFYEFSKNDAFRELLQSGKFRFVENAFVINNPKYIRQDDEGNSRLTPYAIKHPQECTLLFEYAVPVNFFHTNVGKLPANMMGFLTRVETEYKRLPRYTSNVQNDAVFDVAKALDLVKAEFDRFAKERTALAQATDFWERVEQIKTAKSLRNNTFKDRSGLDDATISRIKLKKTAVTLRVAIAVCFGLDLDLQESKKLLALAKLALNDEPECLAYEFVITNFQFCPLFEKNEVLKKFGVDPIGVHSKAE